jgi:hypothetical protein
MDGCSAPIIGQGDGRLARAIDPFAYSLSLLDRLRAVCAPAYRARVERPSVLAEVDAFCRCWEQQP